MPFTNSELRRYSRFIYLHIHRYDYGYRRPGEAIFRVPKNKLQAATKAKSFRNLTKLSEKHLLRHLNNESTYYYTGQRRTKTLLLCVDIDAHESQEDAWDIAKYLQFWWFKECYAELSTNGAGVHLYFRLDLREHPFITTASLHTLFSNLGSRIRKQVEAEGYEAEVCGIYGLPSNWKTGRQAQIIKLPRPQDGEQLNELITLNTTTLASLSLLVAENEREWALLHSAVLPKMITPSLPSSSSSTMIATDKGGSAPKETDNLASVKQLDLAEIRSRNPLYRASWTVRTLANILNRIPTVGEALNFYEELQLGTGTESAQRIRRFTQVVAYYRPRFDPRKKRSFVRMYPVLQTIVARAIASHPQVSVTFSSRKDRAASSVSVEHLCVGYYFALYQLGKAPDGTLPKDGICALNKRLLEAKVVSGTINNQKASAVRRILVELELLELLDDQYVFGHGRGRAKRYRIREITGAAIQPQQAISRIGAPASTGASG